MFASLTFVTPDFLDLKVFFLKEQESKPGLGDPMHDPAQRSTVTYEGMR